MKTDASTTVADSAGTKIPEFGEVKENKRNGICVRIRPTIKHGFTRFVLDYRVNGQRKLDWRSSMAEASQAAKDAIDKIGEGQTEVLNLKSSEAHAYTRSRAILDGGEPWRSAGWLGQAGEITNDFRRRIPWARSAWFWRPDRVITRAHAAKGTATATFAHPRAVPVLALQRRQPLPPSTNASRRARAVAYTNGNRSLVTRP